MNELFNQILNIVNLPMSLISLLFFYPPFLFWRFVASKLRSFFSEDLAGKVVLITGASSGIGEHLAYEYAERGARLTLVARRQQRLENVAEVARYLGAPDVLVIPADVTKMDECKHFIDETVNHFGRLNHLVSNAGIATMSMVEEFTQITNAAPVMVNLSSLTASSSTRLTLASTVSQPSDNWSETCIHRFQETNFWGSVYSTHFAIPYLRKSRGKIVVTASSTAWLPIPRMAFYSASKAALMIFYETLRTELQGHVGVTIVTPGLSESEITKGKFLSKEGKMEFDEEMRDVLVSAGPVEEAKRCAKAIVDSACRGDRYLTVPSWMKVTILWKIFLPEVLEWCNRMLLVTGPETLPTDAPSKRILDLTGLQRIMYPPSIQ